MDTIGNQKTRDIIPADLTPYIPLHILPITKV